MAPDGARGADDQVLLADGIDAGYGGVAVLSGVTVALVDGEILSVVGPNGAGKTTLMRVLMGLLAPDRGTIRVAGTDVSGTEAHDRATHGVALVSEGRNLFRNLTVEENLRLGTYVAREDREGRRQRVFDLFPRLDDRRGQAAGTLSGGEAQMLAIGRGLMMDPEVLLLDEPSLGLAPVLVPEVFEAIERINADGVAVLLVEQRVRKALEVADRGCLLENGEIVHRDDAAAMLADETLVEKYMGGG